ncbi:MAG: DnaJ domain-containing protein [Polyangiaceae bacterium]|nr:DnaJ domain-containing protein [Polyangiaceae bacterium]
MRLPGRLGATTLGDLLGELHRAGVTGTLELVESTSGRSSTHRIVFDRGLVADVNTPAPAPRLGDILVREGFVASEHVQRAWAASAFTPGARLGDALVEAGWIAPTVVDAALRHQLRARLEALFSLRDAALRFHVAGASARASGPPLSPREFLHGKPRARARAGAAERERPRSAARASPPSLETQGRALRTLGLPPDAQPVDVRRAFRRLAAELHPDRHSAAAPADRVRLLRRFAEISQAYHALRDA